MKRLLAILLALPTAALAQISVSTQVTSIGHDYNQVFGYSQDFAVGGLFGGTPGPSFSSDISEANTFSWRIEAQPGGSLFATPIPGATTSFQVSGFWYAGGTIGSYTNAVTTTAVFDYASGAFASSSASIAVSETGNAIRIDAIFNVTGPVEFSGVTFTADFSNITTRVGWNEGTYAPDGTLVAKLFSSAAFAADPGVAFASTVPEPSTYALLAGAGALVFVIRRRLTTKRSD